MDAREQTTQSAASLGLQDAKFIVPRSSQGIRGPVSSASSALPATDESF